MSSTATPTRRRRGRRAPAEEGPRASLKQLLPFLLEHRRVLVIVVVLSILGAIATLAQPLLVGLLINRVQAGEPLGILVWGVFALVVAASVISGLQHFLLQRTGTAVVYSSRRKLIGRLLHLPISEFDARRTGDLVSRVGTDTTLLYAVLTQGLADAVGNSLVFVGALVAMALIDPALLGLIVLVIGLSIGGVTLLSGRIRTATRDQQEKVGELASGVERSVGSIRTVRAAGASDREEAAISALAKEAYDQGVRIAKVSALIVPIAGIALQLSLLVVLGVGGLRVASGAITVAALVTFIMFLFLLIAPLGSTFGAITSVNQALGALGRIQEILDLPSETQGDAALATRVRDADDRRASAPDVAIEFRDVHFRYPDAVVAARRTAEYEAIALLESAHVDPHSMSGTEDLAPTPDAGEVLRGVSFSVPRGSRVALVGPSGAGKSTTLALIERFYDPTDGAVLIDGQDARTLDRAALRARLGYVEQDAPTLAGTIAENLRMASPQASDDDCERVLRAVNLGEVLERNPLGVHAPVGENGVMLSGGERQRLAIARALLAAPEILLLDESTSSLDGLNEQRMRDAIDAVATDRTLIVIAHRLSTVVDSDHSSSWTTVKSSARARTSTSSTPRRSTATSPGTSSWSDPAPRAPTPPSQATTESRRSQSVERGPSPWACRPAGSRGAMTHRVTDVGAYLTARVPGHRSTPRTTDRTGLASAAALRTSVVREGVPVYPRSVARKVPLVGELMDKVGWDGDRDLDLMLANLKKAIET